MSQDAVGFVAACPCGHDAWWISRPALIGSPLRGGGPPTLVTKHDIECDFCHQPVKATITAA